MSTQQLVRVVVDMWPTDIYDIDAPFNIYQMVEGQPPPSEPPEKMNTKRYFVEFKIPQHLRHGDTIVDVQVIPEHLKAPSEPDLGEG